jgi:hypothetical protein
MLLQLTMGIDLQARVECLKSLKLNIAAQALEQESESLSLQSKSERVSCVTVVVIAEQERKELPSSPAHTLPLLLHHLWVFLLLPSCELPSCFDHV